MAHFQLRTEGNREILDIIRELAEDGYRAIEIFFASDSIPPSCRRQMFEQVQQTLMEYVTTYDLCGKSSICTDEVEGAPWLSYSDHIYILDLPENFDVMVDNLAFVALETVVEKLKPHTMRKAFSALQHLFHKRLASCLYFNPLCRNSEYCNLSQPVELVH